MSPPVSTPQKPHRQQHQQLTALQQVLVIDADGGAIINDTTLHPISLYDIYKAGHSISSSLQEFTQVFHLLLDYLVHPSAVDGESTSSSPHLANLAGHFLQTLDVAIPVLVNALDAELTTMLHSGGRGPVGDRRVLDTEICAYSIANGHVMVAEMDLRGGARSGIWAGFATWLSVEVMAVLRDPFVADDGVVFKTTVSCAPLVEEIVLAGNRMFAAMEMKEDDEAVNCGLGSLSL